MNRGPWLQTAMGRQFWPMDPFPHEVEIDDIAHALSMLCRFGGHCLRFYSVAEHSVLLARAAKPEHKLWALLHDASEAYLVDVPRPIKPALHGYKEAEQRIQRAIAVRFNLHFGIPYDVKAMDNAILLTERAQNMTPTDEAWDIREAPLPVKLQFWAPKRAKAEFLLAFDEITGGHFS